VPPSIADLAVPLSARDAAESEDAARAIGALDEASGGVLDALSLMMLRSESVASSKIEQVEASIDDYARALFGNRSNPSAMSMVAATDALTLLTGGLPDTDGITLARVLAAHRALMADDPFEKAHAGRLRDVQNWIGGSDYSPRHALFVPPPHDHVPALMGDLIAFANRTDMPTLVQAALTHAQFETIHPFTDGNGRIGRALINGVLRQRGTTHRVVVPIATALVADRDRYFALLSAYRAGEVSDLVRSFARSARIAAAQSRETARRLTELPDAWRDLTGPVRAGSAAAKLLDALPRNPIMTADAAVSLASAAPSSVYAAIDRLHQAGVLRPLTARTRNQIWGAGAILDELDDLQLRVTRDVTGDSLD
jgi:Fic family protein